MPQRKRKRKPRRARKRGPGTTLEAYRRLRLTWTRNPATQRMESAKRYRRSRRKEEIRREKGQAEGE